MVFQKDTKITILGDGGWGTTLALLLAGKGYSVRLWGAFPDYVEEVKKKRENSKFLPGFKIPESVVLSSDIQAACDSGDMLILAVPAQYMRSVLKKIQKKTARHKKLISVTKGIEAKSLLTMSEVIREELGGVELCVLSGPTIARDVARKMPVAASVASEKKAFLRKAREVLATDYFRLYESHDVKGVELGGALKNVIAIGAGIVQGLGYGSNTIAIVFARGIAEIARLGRVMGAKRETFMGLSGLGDLATTCISPHSRNRRLGEEVGKGKKPREALGKTEMVVEGVDTCRAAHLLAKRHRVKMPIVEAVHGILFEGRKPEEVIQALLDPKPYRELG